MPTPYTSELKLVSFNFAPKNWAQCNGQLLQISSNQALFALLGTTYGGDGQRTFALPNLQGSAAMHFGGGFVQGQKGGEINHTLTTGEMPAHPHFVQAINAVQNNVSPTNNLLANTAGSLTIYGPLNSPALMFPSDISMTGGSQAHPNQSPYLVMNWVICLFGVFPSRN
ncbi:MAG TPA: tail fiber protein [Bryobacteraceae bacterium]|nr:tail fiber protein [Bryobacteraceae bacterium]